MEDKEELTIRDFCGGYASKRGKIVCTYVKDNVVGEKEEYK